jgi:hypothetical protein
MCRVWPFKRTSSYWHWLQLLVSTSSSGSSSAEEKHELMLAQDLATIVTFSAVACVC